MNDHNGVHSLVLAGAFAMPVQSIPDLIRSRDYGQLSRAIGRSAKPSMKQQIDGFVQ